MDEYLCKTCGHPDNNIDPKTKEVLGPIHVERVTPLDGSCHTPDCLEHNEVFGVIPGVIWSRPKMVQGQWCLVCGRFCGGDYEYSWGGP